MIGINQTKNIISNRIGETQNEIGNVKKIREKKKEIVIEEDSVSFTKRSVPPKLKHKRIKKIFILPKN